MMNMESHPASRAASLRRAGTGGQAAPLHRLGGHTVSLATDIGALEACLALERATSPGRPVPGFEGIHSPTAVPYCEFLTVHGLNGALQAMCRLMRIDRHNPLAHPLKAGRFHLSPLLTALRYSREGILEMGVPSFAPGCDPEKMAKLLWAGLIRYLERTGLGFVLGMDALPGQPRLPAPSASWSRLMEDHGLHPDLEVETRSTFSSGTLDIRTGPLSRSRESTSDGMGGTGGYHGTSGTSGTEANRNGSGDGGENHPTWPAGLREALRRGCRLACEPAYDPATGGLEFIWVSSRDMLQASETGDWRGAAPA